MSQNCLENVGTEEKYILFKKIELSINFCYSNFLKIDFSFLNKMLDEKWHSFHFKRS